MIMFNLLNMGLVEWNTKIILMKQKKLLAQSWTMFHFLNTILSLMKIVHNPILTMFPNHSKTLNNLRQLKIKTLLKTLPSSSTLKSKSKKSNKLRWIIKAAKWMDINRITNYKIISKIIYWLVSNRKLNKMLTKSKKWW